MKELHFDLMEELGNPLLNKSLTKKKIKKHKKYTLEEDKQLYIEIRSKDPEGAISSSWMERNGYNAFCQRVKQKHKLKWHEFKVFCGFNDHNFRKKYTLEEDKQFYIELRSKHPEAKHARWMQSNGHGPFYSRTSRVHKLNWHEFKSSCGFND
jgi:hypothetical protein